MTLPGPSDLLSCALTPPLFFDTLAPVWKKTVAQIITDDRFALVIQRDGASSMLTHVLYHVLEMVGVEIDDSAGEGLLRELVSLKRGVAEGGGSFDEHWVWSKDGRTIARGVASGEGKEGSATTYTKCLC